MYGMIRETGERRTRIFYVLLVYFLFKEVFDLSRLLGRG